MTDNDPPDIEEVEVTLTAHDMDHLSQGQPIFKGGGENTLLVIRFDGFEEWQATVPIEELEALVQEWEEQASEGSGEISTSTYLKTRATYYRRLADELQETIDKYD